MDEGVLSAAIGTLREALTGLRASSLWSQIVTPKDGVLARFRPLFDRSHIPQLTAEEFRPFLYFDVNHHWTNLHRQVNRITADMAALRAALLTLTDEQRPIADRLDEVGGSVLGLGKNTTTAILTVSFPNKYGVWNALSEEALVQLELWPTFQRGSSFGQRYAEVNALLLRLASAIEVDLWTLDAVFWYLARPGEMPGTPGTQTAPQAPVPAPDVASSMRFGLERHLHDFLFDNWDQTSLSNEWKIYTVPGDREAGYEFACAAGRIDLLARHKTEKKWLVIELKKEASSDAVVGQVLRYMGWVQLNLAEPGDEVHGLLIGPAVDMLLSYAIAPVPKLTAMSYEVNFRLIEAPPAAADA
jgi:hypothetical protein